MNLRSTFLAAALTLGCDGNNSNHPVDGGADAVLSTDSSYDAPDSPYPSSSNDGGPLETSNGDFQPSSNCESARPECAITECTFAKVRECLEGFCEECPDAPVCQITEDDFTPGASCSDWGSVDWGSVDAGAVDAGAVDAGAVDAGAVDAGAVDAGAVDGSTD